MEANGDALRRTFLLPEQLPLLRAAIGQLGLDVTPALADILKMAETMGTTFALLQPDYVDPDYRDEYVHYYAFTYRALPTRCERLHFFRKEGDEDRYLGFCVLRPIRSHPVCRTMIAPPADVEEHVSCKVDTTVHPLGTRLRVRAFPFMEQDSEYARCAHASIWMVAMYHHLANGMPRRLMSEIAGAAAAVPALIRTAPSDGLTKEQVGAALQKLQFEPLAYNVVRFGERTSIAAGICRYLNSRMPVILATPGHATVLVGYGRDDDGRVFFLRNDESRGPYQRVYKDDDPYGPWELLLVPLPGKIYLTGEYAEPFARDLFGVLLRDRESDAPRELRIRSYVTRASDYKVRMAERGLPDSLRAVWRSVGTPTWIWVVELQDVDLARGGPRCVIGEIAFDGTSSNQQPGPLFGNLQEAAYTWPRAGMTLKHDEVADETPYLSATAIHDAPRQRATRRLRRKSA